jgi:protein SCO1/2
MWIGKIMTGGLGALGLSFAAFLAAPSVALPADNSSTAAEIEIGASFRLTDQNGNPRSDQDFRGAYMLIYFGYTFCPDSCPTALLKMTDALAAFAKRDGAGATQVVPIFISLDPARDTPTLLKDYAAHFSPRLVAMTGEPEALRDIAYGYGVRFARAPGEGETYLIDHTGFIYLMGPDGRYITHFESDVTADEIVGSLMKHVRAPTATR